MKIKQSIQSCILNSYFPEVWYALDNWFALCKGKQILELGSGQGLFSVALSKAGWTVNSVDSSEFAVASTKKRLKSEGFKDSCHLIKAQTLPFKDSSFDGVVCINFLEFHSAAPSIFQEISRVLKPSGRAVVVTLSPKSPWSLKKIAAMLRPGNELKEFSPLKKNAISTLAAGTDIKVEKTLEVAKYLPFQTGKKPLPWFSSGATVSFCVKSEFGQNVNFDSTQMN